MRSSGAVERPFDESSVPAPRTLTVGHFIHGLGLGGAQKVIASIARQQRTEAICHRVYAGLEGVLREEIEKAGAPVRVVRRLLPKFDLVWLLLLARAMQRDSIDVVHTHLFGDSLHAYLAARLAGRLPVVMTLHIGPEGLNSMQRRGYRWLFSRCTRIVACSSSVRDSYLDACFPKAESLHVIPNGIETPQSAPLTQDERQSLRRELGLKEHSLLLATIGRLSKQKGHRYLIEAFADLCRSTRAPLELLVIGDGELRTQLQEHARRKKVRDHIVFAGFRKDVLRVLHVVDIVVFSSLYEGLPVALLEAMATGRCIVVTDAPGLLAGVRGEKEAIVVSRGDVGSLTAALARAVADSTLRQTLGAAARRRFGEEFTVESMASRYEAVYRHAIRPSVGA